jgi:hypothetical protein
MIRDRGNIKWQGFMLPQHSEMLKHLYEIEQHMIEKPVLDEQKLEQLNKAMLLAMSEKKPLHISFYKDGFLKEFQGYIIRLDNVNKTVYFRDINDDHTQRISIEDIVNLEIDWNGTLHIQE